MYKARVPKESMMDSLWIPSTAYLTCVEDKLSASCQTLSYDHQVLQWRAGRGHKPLIHTHRVSLSVIHL